MRNAFIQELVSLARQHPQIALIVGDLGYSVIEPFAEEFPDRFINAGVAEQNMTGLAAGMASEGYQVFTYSIANFPTFRCAEQIRNDVAYHQLPVTVVTVGGGLAYGALGYSHHAIQDYALMRVLPNMQIAAPGDPVEVRACMRYLVNQKKPSYLRLGKAGEPNFHSKEIKVSSGKWETIVESKNGKCLLTTGATLGIAFNWLKNKKYNEYGICTMPLWSMADKHLQKEQLSLYSEVISIEDHLLDGGFGSWLLEAASTEKDVLTRILPIALDPRVCGTVGAQERLNMIGGIVR